MRTLLASLFLIGTLVTTAGAAPDRQSGDTKSRRGDAFELTIPEGRGRLGVGVVQISPELRAHFGAPSDRGLLVDGVRPDSPAARAGLRTGDVVIEVDGAPVESAEDVIDAMSDRKKGDNVDIELIRDGKQMRLSATLEDDPARRPRWQSFRGRFPMTPDGWRFEFPNMRDGTLQKQLDDARKRIQELERRLDRLERT